MSDQDILRKLQKHITLYRITPEGLRRLQSPGSLDPIDTDVLEMLHETGGAPSVDVADMLVEAYPRDLSVEDGWEILRGLEKRGWVWRIKAVKERG